MKARLLDQLDDFFSDRSKVRLVNMIILYEVYRSTLWLGVIYT
jgi:hypothetical protein